jgi:hypothetical protein
VEASEASTAGLGDVLLRTIYFPEGEEADNFAPAKVGLLDVAEAVAQVAKFLQGAFVLAEWDDLPFHGHPATRWQIAESRASSMEIVSISMESPLAVVLKLPATVIAKIADSAVDLAERICTFPPRVSAARHKAFMEKALYQRQRALIEEGRADGVALQLISPLVAGSPVLPARVDFLDPGNHDGENLVPIEKPGIES